MSSVSRLHSPASEHFEALIAGAGISGMQRAIPRGGQVRYSNGEEK